MATILPFLRNECAFDPKDVRAMATAFEDICKTLEVPAEAATLREDIAIRIVELAKRGERNQTVLRDRVLSEAGEKLDGQVNLRP
jgi:ABC-type hemin transport system substrate-binding protein